MFDTLNGLIFIFANEMVNTTTISAPVPNVARTGGCQQSSSINNDYYILRLYSPANDEPITFNWPIANGSGDVRSIAYCTINTIINSNRTDRTENRRIFGKIPIIPGHEIGELFQFICKYSIVNNNNTGLATLTFNNFMTKCNIYLLFI